MVPSRITNTSVYHLTQIPAGSDQTGPTDSHVLHSNHLYSSIGFYVKEAKWIRTEEEET